MNTYLSKNIVTICLLLVLPMASLGQTNLPKYESKGWWSTLYKGGLIRTREDGRREGSRYLILKDGLSGWFGVDYVNGFNYGPDLTLGRVMSDYSRWEVDVDLKYSVEREELMERLVLRRILRPEYFGYVELFGQRFTEDFDSDPLMSANHRATATSLFGWNAYKLYLKTAFGARGSVALTGELQLDAGVWWEGRERMVNNRKRNVFRVIGEDNYPRMRGYDPTVAEYCPLTNWKQDQLVRMDMQLSYSPGRWILVKDDMHSSATSDNPVFAFKASVAYNGNWRDGADYGTLQEDASRDEEICWGYGVRYLSLELNVSQQQKKGKDQWRYFGSAGYFVVRNNIGLADMRHFDASHFLWQESNTLTWFSLLTNYELSTSKRWVELHGEYLRQHNKAFGQYVQAHYLSVVDHCPHYELSYGWQLPGEMRIGLSAGMDGSTFDGLGFNLILSPQ